MPALLYLYPIKLQYWLLQMNKARPVLTKISYELHSGSLITYMYIVIIEIISAYENEIAKNCGIFEVFFQTIS